ncbi:MAG TPA: HIT family protein [Thermodesulfobacteriota bacterium]|jgi:histidine triad (HIT) family protein
MDKNAEQRCIFCEIVAGKAPAHRIYEDELSLGILDINPFAEGHSLVIPKRHVPWWHDLAEEETESLFRVARIIAKKLMKAFVPEFVCLYARGRRIPHTHIFLIPTKSGDFLDSFFNNLERVQESAEELAKLRDPAALAAAARKLKLKGTEVV